MTEDRFAYAKCLEERLEIHSFGVFDGEGDRRTVIASRAEVLEMFAFTDAVECRIETLRLMGVTDLPLAFAPKEPLPEVSEASPPEDLEAWIAALEARLDIPAGFGPSDGDAVAKLDGLIASLGRPLH